VKKKKKESTMLACAFTTSRELTQSFLRARGGRFSPSPITDPALVPDDLQLLAETRIIQYTRKSRVEAHNQRFGLSPDGYIYCLAHPNLVFDVRGESDRDGATLIIYPRKHSDNGGAVKHQRWICEPVSSAPQPHAPVRQNTNSLRRVLTGSSLWS
jgi:hypothetical protein